MLSRYSSGRQSSGLICGRNLHVLWLLVLLASPVCGQHDTVPFHRGPDHRILVSVHVDGKAMQFILDTGAKDTILSKDAVPVEEGAPLRLQQQIVGFRGMALISAAELRLGNHIWVNQPVHVTDLTEVSKSLGIPVEGILGMDVLSQFKGIHIHFDNSTIELEK
jgi:predicted aspartyl protease